MGELRIKGMQIVKDLKTEEEFEILRDFLIADPLKITHSINFWRGELTNATGDYLIRVGETIQQLLNHFENQARFTCSVYSFDKSETEDDKTTSKTKDENPSVTNLHVVKDDIETESSKILRERYSTFIKKINVESLQLKVKELMSSKETEPEGIELANFILSQGLYCGKKTKKWDQGAIDRFLKSCQPKQDNDVPAEDEDLYKRYAHYLGDNAVTLAGIKAEVKFLLNENKNEEAIQLAAFLLGSGEYIDDQPIKWSELQIENFIVEIRDDLVKNPMDIGPELKLDKFYLEIENKILVDNLDEVDIKKHIFDSVKTRKIESLDMFYNVESTLEEKESMYTTFFLGYIAQKFQRREILKVDIKEEIVKLIQNAIDNKEKGLSKAIRSTGELYQKRDEKSTNIREIKEVVYAIAEEKFPEYHKELIKVLGEKHVKNGKTTPEELRRVMKLGEETTKIAIVQETEDFPVKYSEIWEQIKDAKCLDDVYKMARELEKTQSFLVVSEMITHLISSGKINDNDGNPVTWGIAAIEIWINTQFKSAETPNEATTRTAWEKHRDPLMEETSKIVITDQTTDVTKNTTEPHVSEDISTKSVGDAGLEENGTKEKLSSNIGSSNPTQTAEEIAQVVNSATEVGDVVQTKTEEVNQIEIDPKDLLISAQEEITYPNGITIPEGDENFKELYATTHTGFWQGFTNLIKKLGAEGMSKKQITHTLADKIKEIAKNDDFRQCQARNFKRVNINEMYNVINRKASALDIEGWVIT